MKSKLELEIIFSTFEKNNKNPRTELYYKSGFELLTSVMLSAKAKDKVVNKATKKLFVLANTPKKMLALGEENLKNHIKTIGLFNNKAKNIISTCRILIDKYNSKIPSSRSELQSLPGVGKKTASVILNILFKKNTIPVDTHVFRLVNRIGIYEEKNLNKLEDILVKIIPVKYRKQAHFFLVDHGKKTCKSRNPACFRCEISKYCDFFNNKKNKL